MLKVYSSHYPRNRTFCCWIHYTNNWLSLVGIFDFEISMKVCTCSSCWKSTIMLFWGWGIPLWLLENGLPRQVAFPDRVLPDRFYCIQLGVYCKHPNNYPCFNKHSTLLFWWISTAKKNSFQMPLVSPHHLSI